jgi:hypothetical protein
MIELNILSCFSRDNGQSFLLTDSACLEPQLTELLLELAIVGSHQKQHHTVPSWALGSHGAMQAVGRWTAPWG